MILGIASAYLAEISKPGLSTRVEKSRQVLRGSDSQISDPLRDTSVLVSGSFMIG